MSSSAPHAVTALPPFWVTVPSSTRAPPVDRRGRRPRLLGELAQCGLERIVVRAVLPLRDRPGAGVLARPERPAGVHEQHLHASGRRTGRGGFRRSSAACPNRRARQRGRAVGLAGREAGPLTGVRPGLAAVDEPAAEHGEERRDCDDDVEKRSLVHRRRPFGERPVPVLPASVRRVSPAMPRQGDPGCNRGS